MSHLIRFIVFLAIAVLVAGCKVAVIVVEGGEVQSLGSGTCLESEICMVQVNDTNFSETFTAVPKPGSHFVKWNKGGGFFCGDSTNPTCVLSTEGYAENPELEAIIASDQTFYIMPIFGPDTDTITVDGREWTQVDLFTMLSWNDINAVCPAGPCFGVLNGRDMTGWTWASVDDVNALFNYYIGSDELGPGPDAYGDGTSARAFLSDGWRITEDYVSGWVRTLRDESSAYTPFVLLDVDGPGIVGDLMVTSEADSIDVRRESRGAWFYRAP